MPRVGPDISHFQERVDLVPGTRSAEEALYKLFTRVRNIEQAVAEINGRI